MEAILNIVLPVFAIILAGYIVGRLRLLGADSSEALNRFVYYVALPVLLFYAMARVPPAEILNWRFIGAYASALAVTLAIAMVIAKAVFRGRLAENSLFGLAATFSNTGYMGIPLAIAAFGNAGALPAIITTVISSAFLLAVAAALVEIDMRRGAGWRRLTLAVAGGWLRNPLLMAPILGLLWSATGWQLATPVQTFCSILQAAAGPSALFSMGLFLVGQSPQRGAAEAGVVVALKLLLHPLVTWGFLVLFAPDPLWQKVGTLQAALPTATLAFVLAQKHGIYAHRALGAIIGSTVIAVITVSLLFSFWGMTDVR